MSDLETKVKIGGDASEANEVVKNFGSTAEDVFEALVHGSFKDLLEATLQLPARFALIYEGVKKISEVVKEAVAENYKMVDSAISLGERLGIQTSEAQVLSEALDEVGISSDSYAAAANRMQLKLTQNEAGFKRLGVETRNQKGELLGTTEIMNNAIEALGRYKEGTDRTQAAQELFGRGAGEAMKFLRLHKEAIEENRVEMDALGLTITEEGVERFKDYRKAMHGVEDVMHAISAGIARVFMPVLTDLGHWFAEVGPTAVKVVTGAFGGLMAAVYFLMDGFETLGATADVTFFTIGRGVGAAGEAMWKAATGDFAGAKEAISKGLDDIKQHSKDTLDSLTKDINERNARLKTIFNPEEKAAGKEGPKGGTENFVSDKALKDAIALEEAYAKARAALAQETLDHDRQMSRLRVRDHEAALDELEAQDVAFEDRDFALKQAALAARLKASEKDPDRNKAKLAEIHGEIELLERKHLDRLGEISGAYALRKFKMRQQELADKQELDLEDIDSAERVAQMELSTRITADDAMVKLTQDFEQRRFEIQRKALEDRLKLMELDPSVNPEKLRELHQQIELLERKHVDKMRELDSEGIAANSKKWKEFGETLEQDFASAFAKIGQKGMNMRTFFQGLWNSLYEDIVKFLAQQLAKWIFTETAQTAATETGAATRGATEAANSTSSIAINKARALANILAFEAEALAGAFAAAMDLPYPANFAAAAASEAAVLGAFGGFTALAVAEKGYDVPAGVAPLTQLHEQEMVLPAEYANVIRGMSGGDGGGAVHLHVHAVDGKSVERLFKDNGAALAAALRRQFRNFTPTPGMAR